VKKTVSNFCLSKCDLQRYSAAAAAPRTPAAAAADGVNMFSKRTPLPGDGGGGGGIGGGALHVESS
jgi:hypothetical protein